MKKKWKIVIVLSIVIIVLFIPKKFYSEEKLVNKLYFSGSEVIEVTNIMKLDRKNYLVHYKKGDVHYSSLWYWYFFYWKNISNTTTTPFEIIQLNRNNPESIYFTWSNLPTDNGSIDLYLKRNRNAYSSKDHPFYYPELLLKQTIELNEPFGAVKIDKNLQSLLNKEDHFHPYSNEKLINSFTFKISLEDPYFKKHIMKPPLSSGRRHYSFNPTAFHEIIYTDNFYIKK